MPAAQEAGGRQHVTMISLKVAVVQQVERGRDVPGLLEGWVVLPAAKAWGSGISSSLALFFSI